MRRSQKAGLIESKAKPVPIFTQKNIPRALKLDRQAATNLVTQYAAAFEPSPHLIN